MRSDITRAVKGVVVAGVAVMRVEVDINGRIVVIAGKPSDATWCDKMFESPTAHAG